MPHTAAGNKTFRVSPNWTEIAKFLDEFWGPGPLGPPFRRLSPEFKSRNEELELRVRIFDVLAVVDGYYKEPKMKTYPGLGHIL